MNAESSTQGFRLIPRTRDQFVEALRAKGLTMSVSPKKAGCEVCISNEGDGSYATLKVAYHSDGYVDEAELEYYWHSWFPEERTCETEVCLSRDRGLVEIGVRPGPVTEVVFVVTGRPSGGEVTRRGDWHYCWRIMSPMDAATMAAGDEQFRTLFEFEGSPTPRANHVSVLENGLVIGFVDGRSIRIPLSWYPRLAHATVTERDDWHLAAEGRRIEWPQLHEAITLDDALAGRGSFETLASLRRWLEERTGNIGLRPSAAAEPTVRDRHDGSGEWTSSRGPAR